MERRGMFSRVALAALAFAGMGGTRISAEEVEQEKTRRRFVHDLDVGTRAFKIRGRPTGNRNANRSEYGRPHLRETLRNEARKSGYLLHQVLRDPTLRKNFMRRKTVSRFRATAVEVQGGRVGFTGKEE